MFVEKLELFGFKSFPNRTEVPLARGITAIVGPNGCGKSNLSDALRWVLGEQNARTLRGERIQDVIFKGTKTAKPLGMAEVILNVSNDDGRLPLEYSHVAVARRVFRSGESEFSINKVPCRLKDIRDLFSGTGLGSHGYAVIERDMIDQVLSDKDEARRFLFEEAAGIIRYKQRRKESERRLEGVEQDLTRIEDMIREIERGVRSLARQAGKVRRWRRFKEEHDRIAIRMAWERWKELKGQSLSSEDLHHRRENERADLSSTLAVLEARRETHRLDLLERSDSLEQAQRDLDSASRAVFAANEEIRVITARGDAWKEEEKDLRIRLEGHGERRRELDGELERLDPQAEELRIRLTEAEERAAQTSALRAEAEKALKEVRLALYQAQQLNLDLSATRSGTRHDLDSKKERKEAAVQRLLGLDEHLQAFTARQAQVERDLGDSEGRIKIFDEEMEAQKAARLALEGECLAQKPRLTELRRHLTDEEQTRAGMQSRLAVLTEQHERHAGFDAAVRHLLERREDFAGFVGVVGEEVRLRAGREVLGRTLLGDRVQWVLVRDEEAAVTAMGRLRELGLGGVTFFPLREAGVEFSAEGEWRDGRSGRSLVVDRDVHELFEASEAALPFVAFVAATTHLVTSLQEARATELGPAQRLLTSEGDTREGDGTLRLAGGGKEEAEILRREQEIPQLQASLGDLEAGISDLRMEIGRLTQRDEEWSAEITRLEAVLLTTEKARAETVQTRTAGRTELAMLREEHTRLTQERDKLQGEIFRLDEDLARLEGVVHRSELDSEESQRQFESLRAASEDQERQKDERVREATEREMQCLSLKNEVAALEVGRRNLEREAAELERSIEAASSRLKERSEEAARAQERVDELSGAMESLEEARAAGEASVQRAKELHGEAQDGLFRLDAELRGQREKLDSLVHALHAEDVERLQVRTKADQIRDRIREEYGTDLETYTPPPETAPPPPRRRRSLRVEARPESADGADGAVGAERAEGADRAESEAAVAAGGDPGSEEDEFAEELLEAEDGMGDGFESEDGTETGGGAGDDGGTESGDHTGQDSIAGTLAAWDPEVRLLELKRVLEAMGNLNFVAEEEYRVSKERLEFHRKQAADLTAARADLLEAIRRINETAGQMFQETFRVVSEHFVATYDQLFPGGEAAITLQGTDPLEGDIEISARPRGKRLESIRLLSSGERALTAIALLFAIYLTKPSPVCLLDEVDAPLDDANLDRFLTLVRKFSARTQFVCITHNKKTMETADRLFGVTMEEPGISKIVSVQLDGQGAEILDSLIAQGRGTQSGGESAGSL